MPTRLPKRLMHKLKGQTQKSKYAATATVVDGIRFDSKAEAEYYKKLKAWKEAGLIVMFLRQVSFDLGGGTKYRCDFQEFHADGSVRFIDVKGFETKDFKKAKRQVEALYPITIEVVKK